jgi:septum formation protein
MLSILQGRTHQVISSIALYAQIDGKIVRDAGSETTHVTFRSLDISRIEAYLKEVHVFDKAGSYAAQERADMIIDTIEGSTTNVIGLPMRLLYSLIVKNNLITALFP